MTYLYTTFVRKIQSIQPTSMQYWPLLLLPLLLSTTYLLATQIAHPPPPLKPKIFVLGLSKTGTTSIGNALALLGYKRTGWKDIKSRHLVHSLMNGDTAALLAETRYYDAFEDLPWPYVYREVSALYPDARFVLSLRKDEETWVRSLRRHMSRGRWEPTRWFYGAERVEGNEAVVREKYRNHTAEVRAFFAGEKEDRFAELVIDDDGEVNWAVLCRLAECPGGRPPRVAFPRSNTAAQWRDGHVSAELHRGLMWVITRVEEWSARVYYGRKSAVVNAVLEVVWHFVDVVELAVCQMYFMLVVQTQAPLPVS